MRQFKSKVNILRITKTSDGMGGWTEAERVLHVNMPCRINWSTGRERIQFDKITYYRDGKIHCRVTDITTKDRVQYGTRKYEIVDVTNPDEVNKFQILTIKLLE